MTSLRHLPSVDALLRSLPPTSLPRSVVTGQIQAVLSERRALLLKGDAQSLPTIEEEVTTRLGALLQPSLRPVINATGVILHTNLGRAPLADFQPIQGYSNLEYDLQTGKRGKRDAHTALLLQALLQRPAIVVNNNAAAVYLVLNELAAGQEVIISRGELIEIGDGFRIPRIMQSAGVTLREVGTTNRTSLDDYREAITPQTRLILRVHPSNFHITGFTAHPSLEQLSALAAEHGIPLYEDLGSGCLVDLRAVNINEPLVSQSLQAGVNIVSFSCDKLLGGPQSGIIAGDLPLITRIRRNPMYRAFRADKLILQCLQTSLLHLLKQDWHSIPTLRMILQPIAEVQARAERVLAALPHSARLRESETAIGGGATPDQSLTTWVVEMDTADGVAFERRLRASNPPVIARIEKDKIVLDLRTVADGEIEALSAALLSSLMHGRDSS